LAPGRASNADEIYCKTVPVFVPTGAHLTHSGPHWDEYPRPPVASRAFSPLWKLTEGKPWFLTTSCLMYAMGRTGLNNNARRCRAEHFTGD
jgi:hypothetical protein